MSAGCASFPFLSFPTNCLFCWFYGCVFLGHWSRKHMYHNSLPCFILYQRPTSWPLLVSFHFSVRFRLASVYLFWLLRENINIQHQYRTSFKNNNTFPSHIQPLALALALPHTHSRHLVTNRWQKHFGLVRHFVMFDGEHITRLSIKQ